MTKRGVARVCLVSLACPQTSHVCLYATTTTTPTAATAATAAAARCSLAHPSTRPLRPRHNKQVLSAKAALKEFLPVFPDILSSVKTEMASRFLLHKYRSLVEHAHEAGSFNSREFEHIIKEVDSSLTRLTDHGCVCVGVCVGVCVWVGVCVRNGLPVNGWRWLFD
jgi:hypothetical protein